MTADSSYTLEALTRRWQQEKTPQVGLRLAEEYRRKGDLEASIEALASGLEVYPNHTASRVALSRYLVDGGRFSDAVTHLEQIVSLDPAHLVANKLLVGAYAGVGRIDEALDKLAIYEMMGEGDVDIERLRALLEADPEKAVSGPEPLEAVGPSGRVFSTETVPEPLPTGPTSGIGTGDAVVADLADSEEARGDEPAPGTRGASSAPPPSGQAPTRVGKRGEDPFELPAPIPDSSVAMEASGEKIEEPFGAAFEEVSSSSYWHNVPGEEVFALDEVPASAAGADSAVAVEPASGSGASTGSTVTLGKLYLEQGHHEEATAAFQEVLAREPGNEAARRELEATSRVEPGAPAAAHDTANRREHRKAASLKDRRRSVLTTYRSQLRKAIAAGV